MNDQKLAKLKTNRIGGKGTVRRKKKVQPKRKGGDTKALQATLKRLQVNQIPGIEEVNFFLEDGSVQHFVQPKGMCCAYTDTPPSLSRPTYSPCIAGHAALLARSHHLRCTLRNGC